MMKVSLNYSLLIFISFLLSPLAIMAQQFSNKELSGDWFGYDGKGQKVALQFSGSSSLRTASRDDTIDFNYKIKAKSGRTYLEVYPKRKKSAKTNWPVRYTDGKHLKIYFTENENLNIYDFSVRGRVPFILFTRKEKVKISRYKSELGDTAIQHITIITFGEDSVKAIRIEHLLNPVQNNTNDSNKSKLSPDDQFVLSPGWGGGGGYNLDNLLIGSFFIDSIDFKNSASQPGKGGNNIDLHFPLVVIYRVNRDTGVSPLNDTGVFSLNKEDIIYPADPEAAIIILKKIKQFQY